MTRIQPTLVIALGLAAALSSACSSGGGPSDRPNVLLLVVDDLRCELGCYGADHVITPNIDALAARGMVFDRAYVQVAVCNPSRVSMLTSLRPDTTGVFTLVQPFRHYAPSAVTLPEYFAANGWHSVGIGKIHHQPFPDPASWSEPKWRVGAGNPDAEDPDLRGTREFWMWSEEQQTDLISWRRQARASGRPDVSVDRLRPPATNDEAVEDEQRYAGAMLHTVLGRLPELAARKEPFFLAVGFVLPHLPFTAPKRYWDLYDREALPQAENPALPEGAPRMALNSMYELRDYSDIAESPFPWDASLDEADARRLVHGYLAATSFVDAQIGRLLEGLEASGEAENTIVVLWSDHGWKLGEHGSWGKMTNYEDDTRVPFIIFDPRRHEPGRRCARLVESIDLFPTLCDLAGVPIPSSLEGRSLVPLLEDPEQPWAEAAYSQFLRDNPGDGYGLDRMWMGHAVRSSTHRYVAWRDFETGELLAEELYDHREDPDENRSVRDNADQAGVLRRMRELERSRWPQ